MKFGLRFLIVFVLLIPVIPMRVFAQGSRVGFPQGGPADGTITVYLRDEFGEPLSVIPELKLTVVGMGIGFPSIAQHVGTGWVFSNLTLSREYQVEAKADGYQTAYESVTLPPMDHASQDVIMFMKPIGQKKRSGVPGQIILAPRAEKEVERGLKDMRARKFDSARQHLTKALGMAPANPYVNYVMGMIYLLSQQLPQAEEYLARSVSIDPREPAALLALGTARLQLNDNAGAVRVLEQDVQLDTESWKGEWMLASAYLREGNYAKSRVSAERALDLGKSNATPVELILGQALAGLGEREEAANTLENYLKDYPKDGNAEKIHAYAEKLRKPPETVVPVVHHEVTAGGPVNGPQREASVPTVEISATPTPPVDLPPKENWAPPDVDAAKPFAINSAACSLPNVMKQAAKNAEQFVSTLEQFSATEEYQSVEIKRDERLQTPDTRTYSYLVVVDQPNPHLIEVHELRDGTSGANRMAGLLADVGTPALALAFHPIYSGAFNWSCEGLGEWKGKAAWVVHFEQRKDIPTSLLQAYETPSEEYALPLKGRAWVSENNGEIMHLDTDLTHPMKKIGLLREHFSIDYEPVSFRTHKVQLWLPQDSDVYYQYQGHYIHHYHHYKNFQLFWVGATQKISNPKDATPQQ